MLPKTARFAQFLRAVVAVKSKAVLEVNKYPKVIWFSRLPSGLAEVRSPLTSADWPDDDSRWLVVGRVPEPDFPKPPEECVPWLGGVDLDVPETTPGLNPTYIEKSESGEELEIPPTEEAKDFWGRYVATEWAKWARKASVARLTKPFYQDLFSIHQEMKGRDDAYDLYVGVGLLDSQKDPLQRARRHLLAFPAQVLLNEKTGALAVAPSADFVELRIETDFLPAIERARLQPVFDRLAERLDALGPALHNRAEVGAIVTELVHSLDSSTNYADELSPQDARPGVARASFAPALVLRPRSMRSLDELLNKIERESSGENPNVGLGETPVPWRRMMEDQSVWGGDPVGGGSSPLPVDADDRIYFPLPSNEEQSKIIRYATGTAGVVVQGPPGTGKSHTIANLISHYLAKGQRVLVTAQTAQALEVLRDKMPAELQQLCVSLLGDTARSDKDLQRSVQAILDRRHGFDKAESQRKIARLESEINAAEGQLVQLERLLHQARVSETQSLEPVVGHRGTRAQIARQVREERAQFTWINYPFGRLAPCPSYEFGWDELAGYHRALNHAARARLARHCVPLPFSVAEAVALVRRVNAFRKIIGSQESNPASATPASGPSSDLENVVKWLTHLKKVEATVGPEDSAWSGEVRQVLFTSSRATWRSLFDEAAERVAALTDEVVGNTVPVEVSGRTAAEARRALSALAGHYGRGGKRRILGVLKPGLVKETEWVEQSVSVEGSVVRDAVDVNRARAALEGLACFEQAWKVWGKWSPAGTGSPRQQTAALRQRNALLNELLALSDAGDSLAEDQRQWLSAALRTGIGTTDLIREVNHRLAERALAGNLAERDRLVLDVRRQAGQMEVAAAIAKVIQALVEEDADALEIAGKMVDDELAFRDRHQHYVQFLSAVGQVSVILETAISDAEGTADWADHFSVFESGWRHQSASLWLALVLSEDNIDATERAARDERLHAQDLLKELTAERAWALSLERIDDGRRASLVAWVQAVKSIPQRGLSVFRKRAIARRYLANCLDCMPAWVVSLGRLYETVDARPGIFDVAIIDEASQCWLDSLILFYLAKQVIVVGDDKQISPTVVGVADGQVSQLADAFLSDFQFRGSFTIDSSLFDHAQRYLSAGVPLREHFRCVPEIIRFSNELFYVGNPLIPLRQVGKDRLEPLKTTYLQEGLRRGDVNELEARAIVDAITKCNEDPAYDDADFGVICLQGDAQASRIEHLLLESLGPGVFGQRRLRCGNPHAFQGDERDVMFLSMVAAPNANNATLTTQMYQQRFNVAMSRARDQAWLFHSIQEDELGSNCLRRRVLEFFRQPSDLTIHGSSVDMPTLQVAANRPNRSTGRPPKPFDSWFEVDVALALAARGYQLSAQVAVGERLIDLVIEGRDGVRLAVECDGDAWHGPEQYDRDRFRQLRLERAGWRFSRVRECVFYADEQQAIGEVIAACEELELVPRGAVQRSERSQVPTDSAADLAEGRAVEPDDARLEEPTELIDPEEGGLASQLGGEPVPPDGRPADLFSDERSGPFTGYGAKHYPDPRSAPMANVRQAVLDIVAADGPLPKESIYGLYRDGCPRVERAGKSLVKAVNKALYDLERAGSIVSLDEGGRRDTGEIVVRHVDQRPVDVRAAGGRSLEDIPLSELAEVFGSISGGTKPETELERMQLFRGVARHYGIRRFTTQAAKRMARAARLAGVEPVSENSMF